MTSTEFSKLTGITNRQLQWWDERGYIVPVKRRWNNGPLKQRHYIQDQVRLMLVVSRLRACGVSLQKIVPQIGKLKKLTAESGFVVMLNSRKFVKTANKAEVLQIAAKHRGGVVVAEV